jgi:hypothetical protein
MRPALLTAGAFRARAPHCSIRLRTGSDAS